MAQLRGVEPYEAVTPVPHVPAWVLGVTNVRGTVVGVVDLAGFLGLGEGPLAGGRLLVCGAGARLVAFAVAAARDVLDYAPDTLIRSPRARPRPRADEVSGSSRRWCPPRRALCHFWILNGCSATTSW